MGRIKVKPAFRTGSAAVKATVFLGRVKGHAGYEACVRIGRGSSNLKRSDHLACTKGRNPRTAIASALRKAATMVSKRSGAFAGMKRTKR